MNIKEGGSDLREGLCFKFLIAVEPLDQFQIIIQCTMENFKGPGGQSFQELNKHFCGNFGPF